MTFSFSRTAFKVVAVFVVTAALIFCFSSRFGSPSLYSATGQQAVFSSIAVNKVQRHKVSNTSLITVTVPESTEGGLVTSPPPLSESHREVVPEVAQKKSKGDSRYDPLYHELQQTYSTESTRANQSGALLPGCHIPLLNPWDSHVLPYLKKLFTVEKKGRRELCPVPPDHLLAHVVNRSYIRVNETALQLYYNESIANDCQLTFLTRLNDEKLAFSEPLELRKGEDLKLPELEEFASITCRNSSSKDYNQLLFRLTETPEVKEKVLNQKKEKRRLSVLMFYNDGVSHVMARRVLNTTYYYLRDTHGAVSLNGFHTVGLNTFPNMVPYLTGYHVSELPEFKGKYFDRIDWPFLWRIFNNQSYVTGFVEDTSYSTFNYIKKGFHKQPTDYYFKNYINLAASMGYCAATGERVHTLMLHLLDEFLELHSKNDYFFWWFLNGLSHQTFEPLSRVDLDYYHFFKKHFDKGSFKDMLLIFGSDHGNRFSNLRKSYVGQTEERLPLQLLVFPDWFKTEYSHLYETLLNNSNSLTTPFDMRETLASIASELNQPLQPSAPRRGLNLFKTQVPSTRTCETAGIPMKFCVCKKLSPVPVTNEDVVRAATVSLSHINQLLSEPAVRLLCANLTLKVIVSAQATIASSKRRFRDYRIIFETLPGRGRFESTVRKIVETGKMNLLGEVTRISLYGNSSVCVSSQLLKNYCYCMH